LDTKAVNENSQETIMVVYCCNCLIRPNKKFALRLVRKVIDTTAFIPFLLISLILITGFYSIAFGAEISLTPEEKVWLREHPDIKLGAPTSYPPLVIKDTKGTYTGMLIDLFKVISQRLNSNIRLHFDDSWKSIQEQAKNREIDGLAAGGRSSSRKEHLNSTETLYSTYHYIFARTNDQLKLNSVKNLEGMRIGYKIADASVKSLLDTYTGVTPVPYNDNVAMTKGLMNKEVDVLIAWISYDFWRRDKLQGSVEIVLLATDNPLDMYTHIRKDWPELIPILNKVLSSIRQNELPKIMDKWFIERPQNFVIPKIHLTEQEHTWLEKNHTIRVRVTDYPPFIIRNKDDESTGIAIDYMKLVAEKTGIEFEYYSSTRTFRQALNGLIKHQGPDIMPMLVPSQDRKESIIFTNEYFNSPYMIFTRADNKQIIAHINDLLGKKISLLRGAYLQKMMEKNFPEFNLILCDNDIKAIEAVSSGDADAYIGNMMVTSYIILNRGPYNLKISAPTPFKNQHFSMGVRNDWPELANIIDKGLASITLQEQKEIRNRYISLRYKELITTTIIKWGLVISGIILGIILLFFFWNRNLAIKVKERTLLLENNKKSLKIEIDERKKAESKIKESETSLRDAQRIAKIGNWSLDLQTETVKMSDEMLNLLGLKDKNEALNVSNHEKFYTPESWQLFNEAVETARNTGKSYEIELEFSDKNAKCRNAVARGEAIYGKNNKIRGLKGTLQDATQRKQDEKEKERLEKQLIQAQKMESIGTLAGGIAHDFNNILFPILGHSEMLLEDVPENSPFRKGLNAIHTGAARAKGLVKQILTFSRQESGELKLMKIQPIIKEALKLIRSTIPTTIDIKQFIRNDCGIIKADPTQIHQIVMNIATNAYHAMQDTGGVLTISLKEIELGKLDLINPDMTPGVYACLSVADTGAGMNKNLTDKIFDPFFTTKAIGKGTGMGLSVVHGIVTGMKGVIKVYSEPGKGTEFNIYLPVVQSLSEKQEINQTKEPIQGGIERILLVDDEKAIIGMEKSMLERLGYRVTSQISSVEALEVFRANSNKFDLVITDMAMPNMPGDKLSVELTKIRPDIPILLCTGFSETMSEEKAKSLGIKGFLFKPIVMKDLSQKIRKVLDK
jgi:signal transduction histidine kinase/ABC-type amino acid transport substrate-binding protein